MKLAVVGSRNFDDLPALTTELDKHKISLIISGGAIGADSLAEEYAKTHGIETLIFLPDYDRYGRKAPLKRNKTIIEHCDQVVAFWDGKSRGTYNAMNHARRLNKPVQIVSF